MSVHPHPRPRARVLAGLASATALALVLAGCVASTDEDPDDHGMVVPTGTLAEPLPPLNVEAGLSTEVTADPYYPAQGNPALDVLAYDLDLAWNPDTEELAGTATITLRALTDVDEIRLDFSHVYRVLDATVDGEAAPTSAPTDDIAVNHALAADQRAVVVIRYQGTPEPVPMPSTRGDFTEGLGLRVTRSGEVWTMQEPYGAFTWYPVNDQPSDEAVYDIAVTVPTGWSGIANGQFLGVTPAVQTDGWPFGGGNGTTFHWRSTDPVASYVTTLAIGKYTMLQDETEDGTPLTYWLRTGKDEALRSAARRTPELLAWLANKFGPYPFPSGGVVFVDSESAMETQQMVTMGATLSSDPDQVAETLLHEYAHQWFGDAVTPTDWTGVWLNEGWAMFCELQWLVDEGLSSWDYLRPLLRDWESQSRAVAGPAGSYDPDHFAEDNVYLGPALMLDAIRTQVGEDAFYALGRDWAQEHRNASVDRAEFVAFVNQHTGQDLTELMNHWLDDAEVPAA